MMNENHNLARVIGAAARGIIKAIGLHAAAITSASGQYGPPKTADFDKIIADEGLDWNTIEEYR